MELSEAIRLINTEFISANRTTLWADLGSGSGLFTYALAHLLPAGSVIYAIDKSAALSKLPNPNKIVIEQQQLNFITDELNLFDLDGILMANSLHFVRDKKALIDKLSKHIKPDGSFLIVEYDTDAPSWWVPYPISYRLLGQLFMESGYQVNKLQEMPSRYGNRTIYAACIRRYSQ